MRPVRNVNYKLPQPSSALHGRMPLSRYLMVGIMNTARKLDQFYLPQTADDMASHAIAMSSDIVYIYDRLEQRYLSVNSRCWDVLGYTPEQMLRWEPSDIADLIHPKDLARANQHYSNQDTLADDEVSMTTYRFRHLHGDYRKMRCKQKVFSRTKNGSAKCIIGLGTDVTGEAKRHSEIKGLRAEVSRIREFERERIAAWLHDTAVQEVLGAGMLLKKMGGEGRIELQIRACLSRALRCMLDVSSENAVGNGRNGTPQSPPRQVVIDRR
jgi:PAS domain S-box-containing protein